MSRSKVISHARKSRKSQRPAIGPSVRSRGDFIMKGKNLVCATSYAPEYGSLVVVF